MRRTRGLAARMALAFAVALFCAGPMAAQARQGTVTPEGETPPRSAGASESSALTLERVIELLREGIPSANITTLIERRGGSFQLTVDDVVRLRKIGASPRLILTMATAGAEPGAGAASQSAAGPEPAHSGDEAPEFTPGRLTPRDITRAMGKGTGAAELVRRIETEGMRRVPEVDELIDLWVRGVPPEVIRAMARGAAPAPAPPAQTATGAGAAPLALEGILHLLETGEPAEAAGAIRERGLSRPLSLDEVLKLRAAGADDDVMAAVREASAGTASPAPRAAAPQEDEPGPDDEPEAGETDDESLNDTQTAVPWKPSARSPSHVPGDAALDRLWVASVPPGERVYLATARTRPEHVLEHGHYVGRTPLSLTLPAGDYLILVQHEAGEFEDGLAPGWRTVHDGTASRSLLDNADLTFDPTACCLPGSLQKEAELRPVPRDLPRALIGDSFDGLPPYLFDGEILQILRVRDTRITHTMKMYRMRKSAGRSRLLVSTFLPSEGNPLDQNELRGLPPGTPYDAYVDAPALDFLRDAAQLGEAAAALGVTTEHLGEAAAMLRRAGKAILHQQIEGGVRLLTLSVEDDGRIRFQDQSIRPADLFAAPAPPPKKKKKAKPLPPPPPLPAAERVVMPGLGLPRLTIDNTSGRALALLLGDGQLCWVPAGTRREFPVDPGGHEARVLGAGFQEMNPAPRGHLHFSYNALYTLTF